MGSTIAMHRAVLDSIGGFARFADILADDYAIGEGGLGAGARSCRARPDRHPGSAEGSLGELWRHELRWGATVRGVVPAAYVSNVMSMPLPLALGPPRSIRRWGWPWLPLPVLPVFCLPRRSMMPLACPGAALAATVA
jgi:hypothetical protein